MRQAVMRLWTGAADRLSTLEREGPIALCVSALLATAGTAQLSPLGAAAVAGAWLLGRKGLWEFAGAAAGSLLLGRWAGLLQVTMVMALRLLSEGRRLRSKGRDKLILTLCAGLLCVPFFYMSSLPAAMLGLAQIGASVAFGAVFCRGGKAVRRAAMGRGIGEQDVTALFLTAAALCCAAAQIGYGGATLGGALAAAVAVLSSSLMGIYAVAAAAVAGAGAVLGGGELAYVGAIVIGALAASALSHMGRAWCSAAFMGAGCLCAYYAGCAPQVAIEAGLATLCCAVIPRPALAAMGRCLRFGRSDAEERLGALKVRVKDTAQVLDRVSAMFEQYPESEAELFAGKQLRCMSEAINNIPHPLSLPERRFTLDYGCASCPREGSMEAGDSMAVRELPSGKLILLSDGMGSGPPARRESATAVSLMGDLISVGVNELDALDCVNRLMMVKGEHDMYATLDAMLFDCCTGSARFLKLGAPPSYVLRQDKVIELCAETLPIGIVAAAEPAREELPLMKGDMVFMLTDGITDALEGELIERIGASAGRAPRAAAQALLDAARSRGVEDDMTAIAIQIG